MSLEPFTDAEVRRLLAAIYPTRFERALDWVSRVLPWSLGDWADRWRQSSQKRRAIRGRHLAGKGER